MLSLWRLTQIKTDQDMYVYLKQIGAYIYSYFPKNGKMIFVVQRKPFRKAIEKISYNDWEKLKKALIKDFHFAHFFLFGVSTLSGAYDLATRQWQSPSQS